MSDWVDGRPRKVLRVPNLEAPAVVRELHLRRCQVNPTSGNDLKVPSRSSDAPNLSFDAPNLCPEAPNVAPFEQGGRWQGSRVYLVWSRGAGGRGAGGQGGREAGGRGP